VSGEVHVIESEKRAFYTTRSLAERLSVEGEGG
jgi:hypothetical protein